MAQYWAPFARQHRVAFRDSQKNEIKPVGLVLHTAVSNSELIVPTGITRWHFYCDKDGDLTQFFPVNHMAACQLDGNEWYDDGWKGFISVETWDGAGDVWNGQNVSTLPPWTPAQVVTLARLALWLHTEHGVPLIKATGPRGRGIGYHRQFTNTSPYKWNTNHACPGDSRVAQVPTVISRAASGAVEEEDILATKAELRELFEEFAPKYAKENWHHKLPLAPSTQVEAGYPESEYPAQGFLTGAAAKLRVLDRRDLPRTLDRIAAGLQEVSEDLALIAQVEPLASAVAAKVDSLRVVISHEEPVA